ncbi:MAG TPA: DUF2304 domain-containing protein [Oscillatoriaceae cyanobacterium]
MDVQIVRIQILSIIGSVALLGFIVELLRKRKLREEYSLLWLGGAVAFLVLSIWRGLLTKISFAIGVAYPPAALFLALIMGAYLMLLHFSLVFSRLAERSRAQAQEIALLKHELERMRHVGHQEAT